MSIRNKILAGVTSALILSTTLATSISTQASDTGAFVGGMITSRVLGNMRQRTQAEQQQAYYAQQNSQRQTQSVQQAAPPPAEQTTEQKLDELNKLATGGYITSEEYKAKKAAIVNDM